MLQPYRKNLAENFLSFWPDFLLMNIVRTRKLNPLIGNPIDGQIMQIICWHHLLCQRERGYLCDDSYPIIAGDTRSSWHDSDSDAQYKKLTISFIETNTGIIHSYNVGLSFASKQDCLGKISSINIVLDNLQRQGVGTYKEPIRIKCVQSKIIQIIQ